MFADHCKQKRVGGCPSVRLGVADNHKSLTCVVATWQSVSTQPQVSHWLCFLSKTRRVGVLQGLSMGVPTFINLQNEDFLEKMMEGLKLQLGPEQVDGQPLLTKAVCEWA